MDEVRLAAIEDMFNDSVEFDESFNGFDTNEKDLFE